MPNIGKVLKEEIVRLSKKNAVAFTRPLKKQVLGLKRTVRTLSLELKAVQSALQKVAASPAMDAANAAAQPATRKITGKGIRALRRKFKITQAQLAALTGVSAQAVVSWERKTGKLRFRQKTLDAIGAVRAMNKATITAALAKTSQKKRR